MFDDKIIIDDSLKNNPDSEGFSLQARLPYYRGLGLSMIENISVAVDGNEYGRDQIVFSVRGNRWTLDEMEQEFGDRWNFGEKATVSVVNSSALAQGEHELTLAIQMRVSYLPFVPVTKYTKTMTLA